MAPKVCVPADFGRHHIGAPSHGNLKFSLREGAPIKANSIIMSLNSPVIDNLTTDLHLTSLDVKEFSREAVDCFIEASYTGEVDAVNLDNFRDVNKMSHVFQVSWLGARCEEYFVSYLDKLDSESSYPDILFAVEEAVHLISTLRKRTFLDLVVKKMSSALASKRENFINQFLSDLEISTKFQIDACIAIVENDVHILVQLLLVHLETQDKNHLDDNTRYLLQHLDLNICLWRKPSVHDKLFSFLENVTSIQTEDYKLFVSLYKQKSSYIRKNYLPIVPNFYGKYVSENLDFNAVFDQLSSDKDVGSLYSFFDGLWLKLINTGADFENNVVEKIILLKDERGWCKMDFDYLSKYYNHKKSHCNRFLQLVKNSEDLVNTKKEESTYTQISEYCGNEFLKEVIFKDNAFVFQLPNSASKYGAKQFVLSITAMKDDNPDSFSMKLLAVEDPFLDGHQQLPKLHLALSISKSAKNSATAIFPLSWCGKPTCNKDRTFWEWGYIKSQEIVPDDILVGSDGHIPWRAIQNISQQANCTFRLICYQIT